MVPERYRVFVLLLASTGLRISEAIGLQRRHLVLDGSEPHVRVRRGIVNGRIFHGPCVAPDVSGHMNTVLATAVRLFTSACGAARTAVRDMPIRMFDVTGTLSIENTNNAHRTQIGVDTGQSQFGPDCMWTDFEDEAAAARTRAVLQGLVGQVVQVTKQTFYEYDHAGEHVLNHKNEWQTRTRLAPGSLFVLGDGEKVPIDLATAAARPTAAGKPQVLEAAVALGRLVERWGSDAAHAAWGDLPRTGEIERAVAETAARRCIPTPAAAA